MVRIAEFIHGTRWEGLPDSVQLAGRRHLLDTLGAAIGGRQTPLSQIIHDFVASAYGGKGAQLWLDGRTVSPPGAALANGMTIDSLDVHDGYTLTKGHAGVALVPAALATLSLDLGAVSGRELLASLVMGYEVALRAGVVLHATVSDYHTSGAWNALGCAAITGRRLGLSAAQLRHALGIAEYHGPRSQMMRGVDFPTMVKDGSGWGAMAGVSAALLARDGFSGAPAVTVESEQVAEYWTDLGQRWRIEEQYFKPYAVCRWAQPAVVGALQLQEQHALRPEDIRRIRVISFHQAVRLACRRPANTEEAQYSLPFPVAAALVSLRLGPDELSGETLQDPAILRLSELVELVEEAEYSQRFPARRLARVEIATVDGGRYDSGVVEATWGAEDPPSDGALREKFDWLAESVLPTERARALADAAWECDALPEAKALVTLLAPPI